MVKYHHDLAVEQIICENKSLHRQLERFKSEVSQVSVLKQEIVEKDRIIGNLQKTIEQIKYPEEEEGKTRNYFKK